MTIKLNRLIHIISTTVEDYDFRSICYRIL